MTPFILIVAVIGGWMVQMYLTYQQSMSFNRDVRTLRKSGRVSVGLAGKRYRGGRAYVGIAVDDRGVIRDAMSLSGWTTFSRSKPVPALIDVKASRVLGDQPIPALNQQQRDAARQAVESIKPRVTS